MIESLRSLPVPQQRQLIRLLDREAEVEDLADDELQAKLLAVLRDKIDVRGNDLPEYLRRRLVEVVTSDFEILEPGETSLMTDFELAQLLVDFTLEAAQQVATDMKRRKEFETFLRTTKRNDRIRLLTQSQGLAALATDASFNRASAQKRAEELIAGQGAGHEVTANALLKDLSSVKRRRRLPKVTGSSASAALSARAAGVGEVGAGALAVAVPVAAVAGGLYMAGLRKRGLVETAEVEAAKTRAQRARRSRVVQSVVTLCAFLLVCEAGRQD